MARQRLTAKHFFPTGSKLLEQQKAASSGDTKATKKARRQTERSPSPEPLVSSRVKRKPSIIDSSLVDLTTHRDADAPTEDSPSAAHTPSAAAEQTEVSKKATQAKYDVQIQRVDLEDELPKNLILARVPVCDLRKMSLDHYKGPKITYETRNIPHETRKINYTDLVDEPITYGCILDETTAAGPSRSRRK